MQRKAARNRCSSGPLCVARRLRCDLLHERCCRLDFNLARQGSRGDGRRDFQHAVHIFGGQLLDVHALWQLEKLAAEYVNGVLEITAPVAAAALISNTPFTYSAV